MNEGILKEYVRLFLETNDSELEAYRNEVIASVKSLGSWYKQEAEALLGLPVESVWIHGSVLDPNEFSEISDVNVTIITDELARPSGIDDELSDLVMDQFHDGISGTVDAMVLNREQPRYTNIKPLRIA